MSGHSKWSKVKHRKAVTDVRKAKHFTKALREIHVSAKLGGSTLDANPRLKAAIREAKAVGVPADTIERAVKRGAGEDESQNYEEVLYEGYGPGGVAILVRALTDNKHRTASDVRNVFARGGGHLGSSNSVAYLFKERGMLYVPKAQAAEDKILSAALEAGAEDVRDDGDLWEIVAGAPEFENVRAAIEKIAPNVEGEVRPIAETTVPLTGDAASVVMKLIDALDDLDDVQKVFANFDIADHDFERLEQHA